MSIYRKRECKCGATWEGLKDSPCPRCTAKEMSDNKPVSDTPLTDEEIKFLSAESVSQEPGCLIRRLFATLKERDEELKTANDNWQRITNAKHDLGQALHDCNNQLQLATERAEKAEHDRTLYHSTLNQRHAEWQIERDSLLADNQKMKDLLSEDVLWLFDKCPIELTAKYDKGGSMSHGPNNCKSFYDKLKTLSQTTTIKEEGK